MATNITEGTIDMHITLIENGPIIQIIPEDLQEIIAVVHETKSNNMNVNNGGVVEDKEMDKEDLVADRQIADDVELERGQTENAVTNKRKNVRKRLRHEGSWICNERKRRCQAGEKYISKRGREVGPRKIINKKDCLNGCKFRCSAQISQEDRQAYFEMFWKLNQNEKYIFLFQTVNKVLKRRTTTSNTQSRRQYSFEYYINIKNQKIRICKQFFLGTLNISQKVIYTAHQNVDHTPKKYCWGRKSSRSINADQKADVVTHKFVSCY